MNTQIHGVFPLPPKVLNSSKNYATWRVLRLLRRAFGDEVAIAHVHSTPSQWEYALSCRLNRTRLSRLAAGDALIVECRVRVRKGQLGIAVASADSPHFISHERVLSAEDSIQRVRLWVGRPIDADSVIFRNVASDGIVTEFELYDLSAEAMTSGSAFPVSWSEGSTSIPLAELDGALAWAQTVWDVPSNGRRPAVSVGGLEIVDVDELAALLGPTAQPTLPPNAATKALSDWKMETDDAPILEALWRTVAPRRHLEFGTWEGFGTALVARVTDAEIWTLNLPEGEAGRDGATLYAATDAGSSIGRLYRQAGYGDRVHQILCDSRAFDTAPFESNPFDTVLIDGGHTPDVVASDTLKALRVLRPGGTCVWHDFCPDPETLRRNMAPLGVVQAAVENFAVWAAAFERLFWIRKSWILVGLDRK